MSNKKSANSIHDALNIRYGENFSIDENVDGINELANLANRRVHR